MLTTGFMRVDVKWSLSVKTMGDVQAAGMDRHQWLESEPVVPPSKVIPLHTIDQGIYQMVISTQKPVRF